MRDPEATEPSLATPADPAHEEQEASHDDLVAPVHDVSARMRVFAVVLVVALAAVSYTIWESPVAREIAADAVTAPAEAVTGVAGALGVDIGASSKAKKDTPAEPTSKEPSEAGSEGDSSGPASERPGDGDPNGEDPDDGSPSNALPGPGERGERRGASVGDSNAVAARPGSSPGPGDRQASGGGARSGSGSGSGRAESGSSRATGTRGPGTSPSTPSRTATPEKKAGPRKTTAPAPSAPKPLRCYQFPFQQDAQAAYVADLADPWGLDGAPGSNNDDGIACADLPVDPKRTPSAPAGQYEAPKPEAPSVQSLAASRQRFGVYTPQAPFNWAEVDSSAANVGATPDTVGFFAGFDEQFRGDAVTRAWQRDMLPVMTWESRPIKTTFDPDTNNATDPDYRLADIAAGKYDEYLTEWATAAKELDLPFALRLDHEMNGYWYPWSEQANGNSPGDYVKMWRHVHDIFTSVGATKVLWVWSPNLVTAPKVRDVDLDTLYPGDAYVDWVGFSGYYRKVIQEKGADGKIRDKPATFDNTFGESLTALRAVSDKPILLSEIGATETGGKKVEWINSLFSSLEENPDIIGFVWFDMVTTAVPNGQNGPVTNDWRVDSSQPVTAAFRTGLSRWRP